MKTQPYKLAGDIPRALLGRTVQKDGKDVLEPYTVNMVEAETLDEFRQQVENGDDKHILRLAQGAIDIIRQRKVREFLQEDAVADALAGKLVKWADGDEQDYSGLDEDSIVEDILARAQSVADAFIYGSRPVSTGGAGKRAKEAVEKVGKLQAAAAADPELAAKLAELGIAL